MSLKPKKAIAAIFLMLLGGIGFGQTMRSDEKPLTVEEIKKIKTLLAPEAEDLARHRNFLKDARTGLFRLFPKLDCESKNLLRVDGACADVVPGGDTYSFRTKTHGGLEYYSSARDALDFYDLRLEGDDLIADGFLSQGIMVALGDLPLETVSLETKGLKFLNEFSPKVESAEVKKQFNEIAGGVRAGDFNYSKKLKAVANTTYAMRTIAYAAQTKIAYRPRNEAGRDFLNFLKVNRDQRIDLTIAFRIIRKDAAKGVSILWKGLKREDAPEIIFRNDEKLTDIKAPTADIFVGKLK